MQVATESKIKYKIHLKFGKPNFKIGRLQVFQYLAADFLSHFSLQSFSLDVFYDVTHDTFQHFKKIGS